MDAIFYIALMTGLVLAGIRIVILERRNAHLTAQVLAEGTARAQMESQFKLTAQEAVQQAHESFLRLG